MVKTKRLRTTGPGIGLGPGSSALYGRYYQPPRRLTTIVGFPGKVSGTQEVRKAGKSSDLHSGTLSSLQHLENDALFALVEVGERV
jgi:hypothetical protein